MSIDYLVERDEGGRRGTPGLGEAEDESCGQLDRRFEFLLKASLKFQPQKIEGNKRSGLLKSLPPSFALCLSGSFSLTCVRRWSETKGLDFLAGMCSAAALRARTSESP